MNLVAALLLGGCAFAAARRARPRWTGAAGAFTAVAAAQPLLGIGGAVAAAALSWRRRLAVRRRAKAEAESDLILLGELVGLGLTSGLTFAAALDLASREVGGLLRTELAAVLRRGRESGIGAALEGASGRGRRFYVLTGRAALTGAPLGAAVAAFVAELRDDERARRLADARRLPVRLLFPLALLILPGFLLLALGPAVLGSLQRLRLGP